MSPLMGRGGMSARAYTGRATAPDPVTTNLISKNSLQLGIVSNQIQGMTAQMQSLAGSLQVIGNNLATAQSLERQKEEAELRQERILAQQKLREGKESTIEKKIQAAALAPAQRIAQKAQLTLSRLGDFFISILGGWLLNQGLQTISAVTSGNKDKLNEIKNNVVKNLLVIGGVLVAAKAALGALGIAFTGIGVKLLGLGAIGLFSGPILQLLSFIKRIAKDAWNMITGGGGEQEGPPPITTNQGTGGPSMGIRFTGNSGSGNTGTGGPSLEVEPQESLMPASTQPQTNQTATETTSDRGKNQWWDILDLFPNEDEQTPETQAQPQETMMGNPAPADVSGSGSEQSETLSGADSVNPDKPAANGEVKLEPTDDASGEGTKTTFDMGFGEIDLSKPIGYEANIAGSKVKDPETLEYIRQELEVGRTGSIDALLQPVNKNQQVARNVSQVPEEPPMQMVPVPIPQQQQQEEPVPAASGSIGSVEFYKTNNPDNWLVIQSYTNYNVVPS